MTPSDTPTVTEKEAVERERRAFCRGAGPLTGRLHGGEDARKVAAVLYPLPKVRRLREWRCPDNDVWYRYDPTQKRWQHRDLSAGSGTWAYATYLPAAYCSEFADLKANPYEEVDA
jgi:hypothetical protein